MYLENIKLSEINQAQKVTYCMIPFKWMSRIGKSMEIESKLELVRGYGKGSWEWQLMSKGFLWGGGGVDENVLELESGDGCSRFSSVSVQLLSCVRLFATPWIARYQASLSITNSRSSPRLTSIESVMPSSHFILCHPLHLLPPIPPSIRVFSNESTLCMRWPSFGVSASASVLPKNTQDWSPLGWTGWISLQSKGFWRVFSNTTVQKHQFFGAQLSSQFNFHIHIWLLEKP